MVVNLPIVNVSDLDFHDKLELSLAYAGRMIEQDERWLALNRGAASKLQKIFSKCRCYLDVAQPPVLYSTLNPNSAPFVAKCRTKLNPAAPPEVLATPLQGLHMAPPLVLLGPAMGPPTLAAAAPIAPTWVPPPVVYSRPSTLAIPQTPYCQPLVSPPLCNLNPCPFLPTFGPTDQQSEWKIAYPGSQLAPSPPLVMSPTAMLLSRTCSPESSISLPATPVASPDLFVEFPTFVPRYQGPVYSNTMPYVSYCNMPTGGPMGLIGNFCSCLCYGPVAY